MARYISADLLSDLQQYPYFARSSNEQIHYAIARYEKFLVLAAKFKNQRLAPTLDIDLVWHAHMLHPVSYASDCQKLFGYILDHHGGFGEKPEELPILRSYFSQTEALWRAEYGDPYSESDSTKVERTLNIRRCIIRGCRIEANEF